MLSIIQMSGFSPQWCQSVVFEQDTLPAFLLSPCRIMNAKRERCCGGCLFEVGNSLEEIALKMSQYFVANLVFFT